MIACLPQMTELPVEDRVSSLSQALPTSLKAGRLWVETPDTNDAKALSKFCRKITVPLRQALRRQGVLLAQENHQRPVIHVFTSATRFYRLFLQYDACALSYGHYAP